MQLSDREIQNTLDLLKKSRKMGEDQESLQLTQEDREEVRRLVGRMDSMPEVRKDRVDRVKKAIESANYNVTGDDVAKKLIGRIFSDKLQ